MSRRVAVRLHWMRKYPVHSASKKKKARDELTFEVIHWHFNKDEKLNGNPPTGLQS